MDKILAYNRWYRSLGKRPLKKNRRLALIKKVGSKCQKCGLEDNLNVHHIKPLRCGGTHERHNLLVLCFTCHMDWEARMKGYWALYAFKN